MSEYLVEKIETISKQALELATTAAEHPALRRGMVDVIEPLRKQLLEAEDELNRLDPFTYGLLSETIMESFKDLNYAQAETVEVSRRLALFMELHRVNVEIPPVKHDELFPLPEDAQKVSRTLKTDAVNFQTSLNLNEIAEFYRRAFAEQGFPERRLFAYPSNEYISLIFEGVPDNSIIVVAAFDLSYSMVQDIRNVNIHSEADTWNGSKKSSDSQGVIRRRSSVEGSALYHLGIQRL